MASLPAPTVGTDRSTRIVEAVHGRVRGAVADAGIRTRVRTALGQADLTPGGLPPGAILLVRHVPLRLPVEALASGTVRSGEPLWEREGRDRLARSLARAARPNGGRIVPSADAVLFADRSELFACLALDLSRGLASGRWWWKAWSRTGGGTRSVLDALGHDITLLPPVLDTLASWGVADEVLSSVTSAASTRLFRRLTETFGLHVSEIAPAVDDARPAAVLADLGGGAPGTTRPGTADDPSVAGGQPPWSSALGHATVPEHLTPERAALLATALLLVRAPRVLMSPGMRAVLRAPARAWSATGRMGAPDPTGAGAPDVTGGGAPDAIGGVPRATNGRGASTSSLAEEHRTSPPTLAAGDAVGIPVPVSPAGPDGPADGSVSASDPPERSAGLVPKVAGDPPGGAGASAQGPRAPGTDLHLQRGPSPPRGTRGDLPAGDRPRGGVATQLAGVCYLVNVLGPLDLDPGGDAGWLFDDLTGWAVVESLGRGLLDDADPEDLPLISRDPLWPLLAELDGRAQGEPLGSRATETPGAATPDVWIEDAVANGADLPAAVALGPLVQQGVASGTADRLAVALPYVRWRLRDALGGAEVVDMLWVPGRVFVTRTHLDVEIALDRISIAARLAGLDRDPGWVPQLGRVVTFHFVEEGPW